MPTTTLPETTITAWTARLSTEAEGLDLSDSDDRAAFRCRVAGAAEGARVDVLAGVAQALGASPAARSRAAITRALADLWISKAR